LTSEISGISGDTKIIGVFGCPVAHSLSPAMHNAAIAALGLNFVYVPFEVAPEALEAAIRSLPALGIVGVNLTIPHKIRVLPLLDEVEPNAMAIGAVNTVCCRNGKLYGCNTDGAGFFEPLCAIGTKLADTIRGEQVFVLGAGGAARSVVFRLVQEGARVVLANRSLERAQRLAQDVLDAGYSADCLRVLPLEPIAPLAEAIAASRMLVQTTRVGMHPDIEDVPSLPLEALHPGLLVYDLVYNPVETRLLREAKKRGCQTLSGVRMLVGQGAESFRLWTGISPPIEIMEAAVLANLSNGNRIPNKIAVS